MAHFIDRFFCLNISLYLVSKRNPSLLIPVFQYGIWHCAAKHVQQNMHALVVVKGETMDCGLVRRFACALSDFSLS